jgi:dolichol-phosphate mannosyltransferase
MFSIVVPLYNEEGNIENLIYEIISSLENFKEYEIVLVDDCSDDNTPELLKKFETHPNIKIVTNIKNRGQSYSIHKGVTQSFYNTIITIDGDGQNVPSNIPSLIKEFKDNNDVYLVGGIRNNRKDNFIKIMTSKLANSIRSFVLKDNCSDTGCSLKIFDKKIFLTFPFFNGIHRFLPALFLGYGYKTKFINVDHRKRKFGYSKYGTFNRLFVGIRDIIKVRKILKNK